MKKMEKEKLTLGIGKNGEPKAEIDATNVEGGRGGPNLRSDDIVRVEIDVDGDGNGTSGSLAGEQTLLVDGDSSRKELITGIGLIIKCIGASRSESSTYVLSVVH